MAPRNSLKKQRKIAPVVAILIFLLLAAAILSVALGRYGLKLTEIFSIISHHLFGTSANYTAASEIVLINVRFPRIFAAIAVGAALASAGASYQGLFRNPMVSPDLLGASAGAGFGAAFAILNDMSMTQVQVIAFLCGLGAVALTYSVSTTVSRGNNSTLSLVLTGMVVSALFQAFITIIKYVADPDNKLPALTYWLMGGLSSVMLEDLPMLLIPIVLGLAPMLLLRYRLNILAFGDEEARSLGVNVKRVRLIFILCATLATSASVAACGMIGWVGLVIPHFARMLVGPNYKVLLPVSLLVGGIYMLLIDNISRCLFMVEIPLSVLTAMIGAPFFLYLLMKGRKSWL